MLITPTDDCVSGRLYWDPSESMFNLAEDIVDSDPTKLPAGDTEVTMENYFKIASLDRIGTAQAAQFQSGDQHGSNWFWASRIAEDGTPLGSTGLGDDGKPLNKSNSTVQKYSSAGTYGIWHEENSRSVMPREYIDHVDTAYNWYAAVAESVPYEYAATYRTTAKDSVCPRGWQLSDYNDDQTEKQKRWQSLIDAYASSTANDLAKWPISLYSGYYYSGFNGIYTTSAGIGIFRFWDAQSIDLPYGRRLYANSGTVSSSHSSIKSDGFNIRCVLK